MKHLFKRHLPEMHAILQHPSLKFLGDHIHDPNLWHLNRTAVSRAVAIGVFVAFLPLPFQMVVAAIFAILARANLTISVILVWITNPVTIPPILFFCYKLGKLLLPYSSAPAVRHSAWQMISVHFHLIWKPLVLGCLLVGLLASGIAYVTIRLLWTLNIIHRFKLRKQIRQSA